MKKVYVLGVQPDPDGPTFGRVMDPNDFQKSQDFAHDHIGQVVKDLLVAGAASAQVAGFLATVAGNLNVSVAPGTVVDAQGVSYESAPAPTVVALAAADPLLPRIDLIYAALEIDTPALSEFRPFRRLRTQAELEAGTPEYPPTQFNQATQLHTRATIAVHTGVPNAVPVAPAAGANEVPLWQVHVAAGQAVLVGGDLTSVRVLMKSLYQAILDILTLQTQMAVIGETIDDRVAGLLFDSSYLTKLYDDAGNLLTLDADLAAFDARFINQAGDDVSFGNTGGSKLKLTGVLIDNSAVNQQILHIRANLDVGNAGVSMIYLEDSKDYGLTPSGSFIKCLGSGGAGTGILAFKVLTNGNTTIGGNLAVTGNLSKGSGTFLIDHPVDPDSKDLTHGFVEAPRFDLIYRGSAQLLAGEAVVDIDAASGMTAGTFAALTQDVQIWLQNKSGWAKVRVKPGTLVGGSFTIEADAAVADTVEWLVVAERKDPFIRTLPETDEQGHLKVESDKPEGDASLLAPQARTVKAPQAAPDVIVQEVVHELVGTQGYPRHAARVGVGQIPKREVTIHTHDENDNPYVP